jgi:hypothetical protein
MFLTLENLERQTVFLSKGNSVLTGNQCAMASFLCDRLFSYKINMASSVHLKGAIWNKSDVPHTLKPFKACRIPFKS